MNLTAIHANPLQGSVTVPGDKSLAHRATLFAALASGTSRIENFHLSGVTQVMLDALRCLDVRLDLDGTCLLVYGRGRLGIKPPEQPLYCGNSATTMRLLAGTLALVGIPAVLDGTASLRRRPMDRIVQPLKQMSVPIQSTDGHAPLILQKTVLPLHSIEYRLPIASAQVKTCLLIAALSANGTSTIIEPGSSRDHTERLLTSLGISISTSNQNMDGQMVNITRITPPVPFTLPPFSIALPGDFSAAAFFIITALLIPGSCITIRNVGLNPTRTGLLDVLLAMGADIRINSPETCRGEPTGDLVVRYSPLIAANLNGERVIRMIDEIPIFAIAAAFARGTTTVRDSSELRHKESDRITSLCEELSRLGVSITENHDGFTIEGDSQLCSAEVNPHGDHRLAMALVVAGLVGHQQIRLENAEIIDESFPGFISILQSLGAEIMVEA